MNNQMTAREQYNQAYEYARAFVDDAETFWHLCLRFDIAFNIADHAWQSRIAYTLTPSAKGVAFALRDAVHNGRVKVAMNAYSSEQLCEAYAYLFHNPSKFAPDVDAVICESIVIAVNVRFNKSMGAPRYHKISLQFAS